MVIKTGIFTRCFAIHEILLLVFILIDLTLKKSNILYFILSSEFNDYLKQIEVILSTEKISFFFFFH